MLKKVVVITRCLPHSGAGRVVSRVIEVPQDIDNLPSFAEDRRIMEQRRMAGDFPEFANAEFEYTIHDLN